MTYEGNFDFFLKNKVFKPFSPSPGLVRSKNSVFSENSKKPSEEWRHQKWSGASGLLPIVNKYLWCSEGKFLLVLNPVQVLETRENNHQDNWKVLSVVLIIFSFFFPVSQKKCMLYEPPEQKNKNFRVFWVLLKSRQYPRCPPDRTLLRTFKSLNFPSFQFGQFQFF